MNGTDIGRRNLHLIHVLTPDGREEQVWPRDANEICGGERASDAAGKLARSIAYPASVNGQTPDWIRDTVADLIIAGYDLREVIVRVAKVVKATKWTPYGYQSVEDLPVRAYVRPVVAQTI